MWGYDRLEQIRGNVINSIKNMLQKDTFDPAVPVKADISGIAVKDASGIAVAATAVAVPKTKTQRILAIVGQVMIYFVALIFAMLAANQMIFEPKVLRAAIFIIILLIPLFTPIFLIPFAIYYIGRMLYIVYLRSTPEHKNDNPKLSLLPAVFCMLPLTTVPGEYAITRLFKYPFFYPQSDESAERIGKMQKEYEEDLQGSVYKWADLIKSYTIFKTAVEEFSSELKELNTVKVGTVPVPLEAETVAAEEAATPEESAAAATERAKETAAIAEETGSEGAVQRAKWNAAAAKELQVAEQQPKTE